MLNFCFCSSHSSAFIWKCSALSQRCSFLLFQRPGTTRSDRRTDLRPRRGRPRLSRPGRDRMEGPDRHGSPLRALLFIWLALAGSLLDSWGVLTSDLESASNKPKQGRTSRRKETDPMMDPFISHGVTFHTVSHQ